ncbi:type II secretion system F family protein [Gordonia iterans]
MTAIAALGLCALALLTWPAGGALRRTRLLAGTRTGSPVHRPVGLAVVAALPVLAVVAGVGPTVAAGIVAALWFSRRRRKRERRCRGRHEAALLRALSVMTAELSVGAPMVTACRAAAQEVAPADLAVADELARIAARVELGGSVHGAAVEIDLPVLRRIGDAWSISVRNGVPTASLLEALRRDLVQRAEFVARTEAGLAGPRATAMVLAGLPVLGLGLGELMGAHPVGVLLGSSFGSILLVLGVVLAAVGVVWSDAIVDKVLR